MCDTLEGLYKGLDGLLGSNSQINKLSEEFSYIFYILKELSQDNLKLIKLLQETTKEKDRILISSEEFLEEKMSFEEMKNKTIKNYKETIQGLKADLNNALTDKEKLKIEIIDIEKKLLNANTELNALRKKYAKFNASSAFLNEVERVCIHCKAMYFESNNFN